MVIISVTVTDEAEFLRTAFEHAWKISHCSVDDIYRIRSMVDALSDENLTLELTEKQAVTFRTVVQMYNDLSADFVTWSDDLMKQLPVVTVDAPAFYEMLRDFHLDEYASDAFTLFKYWITQDWGYFNSELLNLIERTSSLDWFSVMHWCRRKTPSKDTIVQDEMLYYRKEYC